MTYNANSITTNSLISLPILSLVAIFSGEANHPKKTISIIDNREIFSTLLPQHITLEENQLNILVSFVSKLVNESKDLEGEIVDMVNKHFWDLI